MAHGETRKQRIAQEISGSELDALLCTLPENVLLLSGYWPVVGTSAAVALPDGGCALLVPEDERELAGQGWASEVRTYHPGSLANLKPVTETIVAPLGDLLLDLGLSAARIGYEVAGIYEPSSYSATFLFQGGVAGVLRDAAPQAQTVSGAGSIARLRAALTPDEVDRVRLACAVAGATFTTAAREIREGRREPEVAAAFRGPMEEGGLAHQGAQRAGAFTWCMSGPNSALAGAAFAMSRNRQLQPGDLVLLHCNSYIDGYWTDITRTFCLGAPDERQRAMYDAIFAARSAALAAIRPGVPAAGVDRAAREVLEERGYGKFFTHGIGHSVGFSAISAEFPPRLHPASPDRLEAGMTFNIEPAIYIKEYGGIRHCDVVTVHDDGAEVLTDFQSEMGELIAG
ncbi:MAG: M24 family metallopeptidase [Chloroflexota bacterium]